MQVNYTKVAYCSIILFLLYTTSYTQDNWTWLNPKPMGSRVESCGYFPGTNTIIAVGRFGLIMRSTDNGSSWSHIQSNLTVNLLSVSLTSSTTGYIAGESATLLKTTDAGVTWTTVNTGLSGNFNQIDFIDESIGFLRQGHPTNEIHKTTNGGTSWTDLLVDISDGNLTSFNALSESEILYGNSIGKIIKASSPSWSPSTPKIFTNGYQVVSIAVNGSNVVAASGDTLLLCSTDNGTSWSSEIPVSGISFAGVEFISPTNLVAYSANETIKISTDKGATWSPVETVYSSALISAAGNFSGKGIILGDNGNQYSTVDGGLSWEKVIDTVTTSNLNSIFTLNGTTIWAAGNNGVMIKSTDSGISWTTLTTNITTAINDVKFLDSDVGYFVAGSSIYKTIDGGSTWGLFKTHSGVLYELTLTDANNIIIAASNKNIYYTTNGGVNWAVRVLGAAGDHNSVYYLNSSTAFSVGSTGKIFKTANKGVDWLEVKSGTGTLNSIYFSTQSIGWAVGNTGRIYKSVNSGTSWDTITSGTSNHLQSVRFSDSQYGIIVGNGGVILKTTNGGTTWTKSAQITENNLMSAALVNDYTTLVAGNSGTILKSSNAPLPVELTSFTASVRNKKVELTWQTATEIDNYGFEIHRKTKNSDWEKIGFVEGHNTSNSPKYYNFTDIPTGTGKYSYRLKQIDNDGTFEESRIVEVLIDNLPNGFILEQNYPNPFNPETTIKFALKENTKATLKVYDIMGELVATLFDDIAEAGRYYDIKFTANNLASGFYIYRLEAGKYHQTRKMILMK